MSNAKQQADKQIVSLRTTVSQQSCALLQELAEALGSSFDPFVENILPILAKMS
jgi:CLIP-associating protein 1/2